MANPTRLNQIAGSLSSWFTNPAGQVGTTGGQNQAGPARFLLHDIKQTTTLFNRTTGPCRVRYFICEPRMNLNTSMDYTPPSGGVYPWTGSNPVTAIDQGIDAAANAGNTADLYNNPTYVPNNSPIFRQHYKILKEEEVEFAVGGQHTFRLDTKFDKVIDASVYSNPNLAAHKSCTRFIVFQAVGPASVVQTGPNSGSNTYGVFSIGVINEQRYTYTAMFSATTVFQGDVGIDQGLDPTAVISGALGVGQTVSQI